MPAGSANDKTDYYFKMNGRDVFEFASTKGAQVIVELLEKHCIDKNDVASFVAHQANINILSGIARTLGVGMNQMFSNLERLGNTAGASVLIALDEYFDSMARNVGKYVVLASFGGGLSWGASALRL
jgi:3-oxoacyl-[acyl-carrier-protein] synthase-3